MNANHSNTTRHTRNRISLAGALLALVGGVLLAMGPLGCGTDDWNSGQGQSAATGARPGAPASEPDASDADSQTPPAAQAPGSEFVGPEEPVDETPGGRAPDGSTLGDDDGSGSVSAALANPPRVMMWTW